jgi:hypothetical protein
VGVEVLRALRRLVGEGARVGSLLQEVPGQSSGLAQNGEEGEGPGPAGSSTTVVDDFEFEIEVEDSNDFEASGGVAGAK